MSVTESTAPAARAPRRPPRRFRCRVVGMSFSPDGYPGTLMRLDPALWGRTTPPVPVRLVLVRAPANPADPNAVAVVNDALSEHLGHLPRWLAERLAPDLDAGAVWEVSAFEVMVSPLAGDQPGLEVEVTRRG